MTTVATHLVEALVMRRSQAHLRRGRRFAEQHRRRRSPEQENRMDSRAPRGSRSVCGQRRGPAHRDAWPSAPEAVVPGIFTLLTDCMTRTRRSRPVLAIAAQIPSSEIGTDFFQETHPERLFQECSHYCQLVSTEKQMPRLLQIAMQTCVSRGGVSVLVLPGDVASSKMTSTELEHRRLLPAAGDSAVRSRFAAAGRSLERCRSRDSVWRRRLCGRARRSSGTGRTPASADRLQLSRKRISGA